MTDDEQRLRFTVSFAERCRDSYPVGDPNYHFWAGYRAFAVVELERVLREETQTTDSATVIPFPGAGAQ